jgi:5-formyltetrahydrofolate cyclo-ligase
VAWKLSNDKNIIRAKIKKQRTQLSRDKVLSLSRNIQKLFFKLPEFTKARSVAFYVAKQESGEVETKDMIQRTLELGKKVLVPVVESHRLIFSELLDFDSDLVPCTFGILEPKPDCRRPAWVEESDLVVVPGLAFDSRGFRLGYGKGYYDRLAREVASTKPFLPFVGLAYEFQLADKIPATPKDMRVNILVTEKRVLRFQKTSSVSQKPQKTNQKV